MRLDKTIAFVKYLELNVFRPILLKNTINFISNNITAKLVGNQNICACKTVSNMEANQSRRGGIILVIVLLSLVQTSFGINNTNTSDSAVESVPQHKPQQKTNSPLLLVTLPLLNITRYYCSKGLPLKDWAHSTFIMEKLMDADDNTHNTSGLHKLANTLRRCAKYYRGDDDWTGLNIKINVSVETTTTQRPGKLYSFVADGVHKVTEYVNGFSFDYFKDLSTKALKAVKIMKKRRKRDASVIPEALKIVLLLHNVAKLACQPAQLYPIVDKYFQKIVELMEFAVDVEIKDDHVKQFASVRKAMEKCLTYSRRALWEQSAEILGD